MSRRTAKSAFHGAFSMLHDAIIKKGFVTITGEVSLPYRWDEQDDVVSISYRRQGCEMPLETKCLLMGGDTMVVNLLHGSALRTLDIQVDHYIGDFREHSYDVRNIETFERKIYEDLLYPLVPALKPSSSAAAVSRVQAEQPGAAAPPPPPPPHRDPLRDDRRGMRDPGNPFPFPFRVGGDDLDPFRMGGPGGGGMIMDPMRGMRAGGGRLPGARFDPIGPGGFGPDNDELMPPGRPGMPDIDDMFM